MTTDTETRPAAAGDAPPKPQPPGDDGWSQDKQGRYYVAARGRSGVVYRKGTETVEEAYARDAKGPADRKPGKPSSAATPKKPPAPTRADLKQIESALADALRSPAMLAASMGEEWMGEHFMKQGPVLARNLVVAAEHNPWLRQKLEAMIDGPDMFMQFMTLTTLTGALVAYAAPPLLYVFSKPGDGRIGKARDMFAVPERKPKDDDDAAPAAPPQAAASTTA